MICVVLVDVEHALRHWRWEWLEHVHHHDDDWDNREPGGCTHGIPHDVPAKLDPRPLATALVPILAGEPADGTVPTTVTGQPPAAVVWVDGGDEVVAHLDSLAIKILDGVVIASIDLEDDDRRAPVVVRFAVSGAEDSVAGLIAATDEVPGGHPAFAARWGTAVQNAAWAALLGLAREHAEAHGQAPAGISAVAGALRLHLEEAVDLTK